MESTPRLDSLLAERFEGVFYDGVTSRPYLAWVWIQPAGLRIVRQTDTGEVTEHFWYSSRILKDEFNNSQNVVLRYEGAPPTRLDVKGQGFFQALLGAYPLAQFQHNVYYFVLHKGWGAKVAMGGAVVAALWFLFAFAVPFVATQLANQTSERVEQQIGEEAWGVIENYIEVEPTQSFYLQAFFRELFPEATNVEVVVADDDTPNAFAVPGHIVVFSGLLEEITSEEQLAGLLAHEYGHIVRKHSLRRLYNDASIWLILGSILGDPTAGSDYVLANASGLIKLDYSRGMEREADRYAIRKLQERNLNPKGMAELFQILKDASEAEFEYGIPDFLSTHPGLEERIETATQAASATIDAALPSDRLRVTFQNLRATVAWSAAERAKEDAEDLQDLELLDSLERAGVNLDSLSTDTIRGMLPGQLHESY